MKLSFRHKTILGIALIEAVMLLLLVGMSLSQLESSNRTALSERARTTATLFATMAKDAVLSTDLATLETFVDEMMRNPGIVYIRVHAYDTVLAERGIERALQRPFREDSGKEQIDDDIFDTAVEIREGDQLFGRIELGLSTTAIASLVESATRTMSTIALAEIVLVAVFSFLLGTYLTRQIASLNDGVRALTRGQVGAQIPVKGHDELAQTARCFNEMSTELENTQVKLKAEIAHSQAIAEGLRASEAVIRGHKENLEERVRARTAELRALLRSQSQLIEHANAPIFTLDHKLNVTGWNRKAEELTGIPKDHALGQNGDKLIFKYTQATTLRDACQAAALQGHLDEFEINVPTDTGRRVWLLGMTAVRGSNRMITGYTFVGQDITHRGTSSTAPDLAVAEA